MKMRIAAAKLTIRALHLEAFGIYNDEFKSGGTGTYKMVGMERIEMPITWNESKSEFCLWGLNALNIDFREVSFPLTLQKMVIGG